jgi:hypothetical protein
VLGFAARQYGHSRAPELLADKAIPSAALRHAAAPAAKKAAAKKGQPPAAKKATKASPLAKTEKPAPSASNAQATSASAGSSGMLQKMTDSLRKMGEKRPGKQVSLRRALKPLLGAAESDESIEVALRNLIARSVGAIGASGAVTYPQFAKAVEASAAKG